MNNKTNIDPKYFLTLFRASSSDCAFELIIPVRDAPYIGPVLGGMVIATTNTAVFDKKNTVENPQIFFSFFFNERVDMTTIMRARVKFSCLAWV